MQILSATTPESADAIHDFLATRHTGVLATVNEAGDPHAASVYFSVDDDLCLTFITKTKTQKYKNIEKHSRVFFVCTDEEMQTTAQLDGHAKKITDATEHQRALDAAYHYAEKGSGTEFPPIEKLFAGDYVALKIVPRTIRMAVYLRNAESNEELYETVTLGS